MTSRDAFAAVTHPRRRSGSSLPWYLQPDAGERPSGLTGAGLEREVDRLGLLFPGRVQVH